MQSEPKETPSRIEEVLLAFGGERVCGQDSEFDDVLPMHAELVTPSKVRLLKGREHNCHRNASGFYIMNYPAFKLVTGYALSGEVWHRHSWLAAKETIIETTTKRRLYFGVTLNDFQTAQFIMSEVFAISPSLMAYCEEQGATGGVGDCQ